ncbi:hypothetical protein SAMN05428988_3261 [Chitinophaga sp. YR573]|nr:hypothetical protein SAMN05428988_3261 [Chitinophaga sp. YR573]
MINRIICLPIAGETIGRGNLFIVTNPKHQDYATVHFCTGTNSENMILSSKSVNAFHFLSVCKVTLYHCCFDLKVNDQATVYYDTSYTLGKINHFYTGTIVDNISRTQWLLKKSDGTLVPAPKKYCFRVENEVPINQYLNGKRRSISRRMFAAVQ